MNEEERNKIIKEISEINKKINQTYSNEKIKKYNKQTFEMEFQIRTLKKPIYKKYLGKSPLSRWSMLRVEQTNIKSSVKRGIKRGLGAKYLNQIYEGNFVIIVNKLIEEDLKKINCLKLEKDISEIRKKLRVEHQKSGKKRKILMGKIKKLSYQLNKKKIDKERKKEEEMMDIGIIIDKKLPELLPKIRQEVTKELILEGLKNEA